ncbi:MAG: radical SAM protein [Planctomycetota bacterium]
MDLINRCNLRCRMCHVSIEDLRGAPRREMSVELFRKIADDVLPRAKALILTVGYEPLLAKSFLGVLDVAKAHRVPYFSYTTNGTLLSPEIIERTIQAGVTDLIVSLDGATKRTFEAIRRGGKFEQVVSSLRELRETNSRLGSRTPEVGISMVLMRQNIKELPAMLRLAKEHGVRGVSATHLIPHEGLDMAGESLSEHRRLANSVLDRSRRLAEELDVFLEAPCNFPETEESTPALPGLAPEALESGTEPAADISESAEAIVVDTMKAEHAARINQEASSSAAKQVEDAQEAIAGPDRSAGTVPPEAVRHWPWTDVVIFPDGSVAPCCYWYEDTIMGRFGTQSFEEIWNGRPYLQLRKQLTTNSLRSTCRNCPVNRASGRADQGLFFETHRPPVTLQIEVREEQSDQRAAILTGRLYNRLPREQSVRIRVRLEGSGGIAAGNLVDAIVTIPSRSEQVDSIRLPDNLLQAGANRLVAVITDPGDESVIYEAVTSVRIN